MSDFITPEHLSRLHRVRDSVREEMHGIDGIINLLLIALVVRGHVLLEGNPGLGKTALIRSLSRAMDLPSRDVGRIQFTPDLMPSDITGTRMPQPGGGLAFEKGPIFCKLLLADEINRATPKTQAAMLEAMAEFQVTVLGEVRPLTEELTVRDGTDVTVQTPFMVMATQNPIEQEGTYPLPEAQLDRFLFKAVMPFPSRDTLARIVAKDSGLRTPRRAENTATQGQTAHDTFANLHRLERGLRQSQLSDVVARHILNIVMASVTGGAGLDNLSAGNEKALKEFCADRLDYELGPRAAISLTLGTLGWAAVAGIDPNETSQLGAKTPEALAAIALPVLRHRMKFDIGFDSDVADQSAAHDALVRQFVQLCAPATDGYADQFAASLEGARETARF